MKIVISEKIPNLTRYGEQMRQRVQRRELAAEHLAALEDDYRGHVVCRESLLHFLDAAGVETVWIKRRGYWPQLKGVSAVLALGGDGTLLEASHHIGGTDVPLLGIRSSPMSVGYLCAGGVEDLPQLVAGLVAGTLPELLLPRLRAEVSFVRTGGRLITEQALNDMLYAHLDPAATTRFHLLIRGRRVSHRSSGIWVATGAGSTAAMAAAGGECRAVDDRSFQFWVREPYAPPNVEVELSSRHGFVDGDDLEIESFCSESVLAIDGPHERVVLGYGDRIRFFRGNDLRLLGKGRT